MSSVERFIANGNEIALGYELQTYATRLDVARKLTQCFHSRISPDFKDGGEYLEILSDAWRRVAGAAVDLGASFGRVLDRDAMRSVSVKQARTTEILKAVSVGEAPCVDTKATFPSPDGPNAAAANVRGCGSRRLRSSPGERRRSSSRTSRNRDRPTGLCRG